MPTLTQSKTRLRQPPGLTASTKNGKKNYHRIKMWLLSMKKHEVHLKHINRIMGSINFKFWFFQLKRQKLF